MTTVVGDGEPRSDKESIASDLVDNTGTGPPDGDATDLLPALPALMSSPSLAVDDSDPLLVRPPADHSLTETPAGASATLSLSYHRRGVSRRVKTPARRL